MLAVMLLFATVEQDNVSDFVRRRMAEEHIPGSAIAAIPPIGTPLVWSFGKANLEAGSRFNSDTHFRIASLSKAMTAYVAMTLEVDGKWSLTDSVRLYVPELPSPWSDISLSDLISHRSGIADPGDAFDHHAQYTDEEFLSLVSRQPLSEVPGTTYRYNNFGYAVLQIALQRRLGESLAELLRKRLFDPLAMRRTHAYSSDSIANNTAVAYHWRDSQYVVARPERPDVLLAAGGVVSTLRDLMRWEQEMRSPQFTNPAVFQRQFTPYGDEDLGYGGGWVISEFEGMREIQHTGETFGFTSAFLRNQSTGWTVIVLRNSDTGSALDWARKVHSIVTKLPFSMGPHKIVK
ncbi:MAG: beta-lactamase family protein [Fimbriimonadaceae bacterium]|nr:beta-lactamase family protein [Fimbriimonadaceae bacterium]